MSIFGITASNGAGATASSGAANTHKRATSSCCHVGATLAFGILVAVTVFVITVTAGLVITSERSRCEANAVAAQNDVQDIEARIVRMLALQIELEEARAQAMMHKKRADEMLLELREWKRGRRRKDGIPIEFEYMYEVDPGSQVTAARLEDKTWKAPAQGDVEAADAGANGAPRSAPVSGVVRTAGMAIQEKLDAQVRAFKEAQRELRRKKQAEEAAAEGDKGKTSSALSKSSGGKSSSANAGDMLLPD